MSNYYEAEARAAATSEPAAEAVTTAVDKTCTALQKMYQNDVAPAELYEGTSLKGFCVSPVADDPNWKYMKHVNRIFGRTKPSNEGVSTKVDAAEPGQLNFQNPATAIMEKIVDLHHDLMFFIIVTVVFVS